jgi:predicted dithiol-disulfide oxidoreductase (DUF899 family)
MTEREEAVATAMHELAAARKRMPMARVEHDYRFAIASISAWSRHVPSAISAVLSALQGASPHARAR